MENLPMVRVHIEKMKEQICNAFILQNNQINQYIKEALDKVCTDEYIKALVEENVTEIVPDIMKDVFRDYSVRAKIRDNIRANFVLSDEVKEDAGQ